MIKRSAPAKKGTRQPPHCPAPNGSSIKTAFFLTPVTASLKAMIKPGQIIGQRQGGEPDSVLDHFYTCPACGQLADKRDLGQVLHHEVPAMNDCRRTDRNVIRF